jgi:hypothetical protein
MTLRTLEEDLRRMGLSDREIHSSFPSLMEGKDEDEMDLEDEFSGENEDFEEDAYLSDMTGGEDDEDGTSDSFIESLSDDVLDVIAEEQGLGEGFVKLAQAGVRKKRRRKMKKWLKTAAGQRYMMKKLRMSKSSAGKMKQEKYRRRSKARGGPRKGYRMEDMGGDSTSALMESISELASSLDHDDEGRFDEYVEAFNHIADLGEVAYMNLIDEDEDAAKDVLNLSLAAEKVLKKMEDMDGSLTEEEDVMLEETLADAMESVGEYMEKYDLFEGSGEGEDDLGFKEEDDLDFDEEDEGLGERFDVSDRTKSFFLAAEELREARGRGSAKRQARKSGRKLLGPGMRKVGGKSQWSKKGSKITIGKLKARKDVENPKALYKYLALVKRGIYAPGQPTKGNAGKKGRSLRKNVGSKRSMAAAKKRAG